MTKVRINVFDQDEQVVVGTFTLVRNVSTSARFNGYTGLSASGDGYKYKVSRYFPKSGTYKVKYIYATNSNAAIVDVGINGIENNIFSGVDLYSGSLTFNVSRETTIQVGRGIREITFKANGKNGSSSAHGINRQLLEFELIAEHPVLGEEAPAQINQGSMVLLARHKAEQAESTRTFNLADITSEKYSEVIVKISGEATASLELRAVINGLGTNYIQKGENSIGGTVTGINITTGSVLRLASTSILTGATTFNGEFTIQKDETGVWGGGMARFRGYAVGKEDTDWNHDAATANKLTTITISTSASTWKAGTTIEVYGVKRT